MSITINTKNSLVESILVERLRREGFNVQTNKAKNVVKEDQTNVKAGAEDVFDRYIDFQKMYSFESRQGVRNLTRLVNDINGYRDIEEFLEDNPGAIESIFEWISEQVKDGRVSEWVENLASELPEND